MSSVKWVQGVVMSLSLLLGACGGGGGDSDGDDTPNSAPTAAISSPMDGSVYPESSNNIAFTGTGSDSEDGTLSGASLEWSSSADGSLGTGTMASATLSTGSHTISLNVTDSAGKDDTATIMVMINASPVIGAVEVVPSSVNVGSSATFSWNITDADGSDTLTCSLDVDADGTDDYTINDCASNTSQTHTYTQARDYQARLTVLDGVNTAVQQNVSVTVTDTGTGNVAPQVDNFSATPDALVTGSSTTFNWDVSDAEGDTLTCLLDINNDGTSDYTINDCANNTSQAHTYAQADTYTASLTVSDDTDSSAPENITVTVSTPPVISEFIVTPNPAYSTVATTFYWQVSDPDGDTLTCLLDVDGDGTDDYTIDDCANMAAQDYAYASVGDYTARLTVRDGVSDVQDTVSVTVKSHLVLDVTANGPVNAEGRALYTMTVSNVSALPIDDVLVVYTVPPELQFHGLVDAEPNTNCGSACIDGEEAAWALNTLAAGESRTITINAPVLPGVLAGTLISAPIRVTSPDVIDTVNVTKVVAVHSSPMSQLAMSASKDPVMPGESLSYQFNIGNIDATALDNLELRATLPVGATVNSISDGGTQDGTTGEIVWNITSLEVANTLERAVNVTVDNGAIAGQILTARAELRHDGGVALDASAEHAVTVVADTFPLMVDISATPDPVVANGRLLYGITVSNVSAVPVNTVVVQFRVPPELQFHGLVDAEPNTNCGSACIDGEEAAWALNTLAAGESRTITINAPVLPGVLAGTLISAPIRVTSPDVIDIVNRINTTAVSN